MKVDEISRLAKTDDYEITVLGHEGGGWVVRLTLDHAAAQDVVTAYNVNLKNNKDFYILQTQREPVRIFKTLQAAAFLLKEHGISQFKVTL